MSHVGQAESATANIFQARRAHLKIFLGCLFSWIAILRTEIEVSASPHRIEFYDIVKAMLLGGFSLRGESWFEFLLEELLYPPGNGLFE